MTHGDLDTSSLDGWFMKSYFKDHVQTAAKVAEEFHGAWFRSVDFPSLLLRLVFGFCVLMLLILIVFPYLVAFF